LGKGYQASHQPSDAITQMILTVHIAMSSSEMLKPHWLKSSHVTGTIKAYCFFYAPTGANMNVNNAFFSRHVEPQIPMPEK